MHPSIDHTILSPNGRVSKAAREAALRREAARLFPPGYWDPPAKTEAQVAEEKAAALERSAADLRALAARGMTPRKFTKAAERLEAEASTLRSAIDTRAAELGDSEGEG